MAIDQKIREFTPKFRDVVAKAWSDEGFKNRLLADPKAVLIEQGIEIPADKRVRLIESVEGVQLLLLPPNNQDGATMLEQMVARSEGQARQLAEEYAALIRATWVDPALRQRLIDDPGAVLRERGSSLPDTGELRVMELAPDEVPLVLPHRPGTGELSDRDLDLVVGGMTDQTKGIIGGSIVTLLVIVIMGLA